MMVTVAVVEFKQVPLPKLYVTVYVPGVLEARLIAPDALLMTNPVVDEYVPPVCPVCVTAAVPF